tara:strand:+ start:1122 stop:1712 length:591 start_codon:yes stop_codon:yes gene_type:complete
LFRFHDAVKNYCPQYFLAHVEPAYPLSDLTMDAFGTMDSETAALILQLQIQDSDELFSACEGKGKGIEGVLTDTQLALQLYKEGLQRSATIIADQNMARSLARACQTDGNMLALSFSQEQREARDRQVALRLGGVPAPLAIAEGATNEDKELDDEMLKKLNALYICAAGDDRDSGSGDNSKILVPYHSASDPSKSP